MNIGFKEDLYTEFKSDLGKLSDEQIVEAVVAFANTDGGKLYIGVEDDGDITGLHESHKNNMGLSAMIANKTVPPIPVRTIVELRDGVQVVVVEVPKRTAISSTSTGKVLRRRIKVDNTPENIPMYPYEINSRLSDLRLLDFSSLPVPESEYSDLDSLERDRLRRIIREYRGEETLIDLSDEELDLSLRLAVKNDGKLIPTYTGLLLIGKKDRLIELVPTAETAIQVFSGTEIKVNESFTFPLLYAFEIINDYFNANNKETELEMGLYRMSIYDVDKRAFRESLVNAFCHRDYSVLGRVRIQLDDHGLTINNPGGFIDGITIDNLLDAEPYGRNPVLADALKRIGLAERTGRGIDRIFEGSLLYGRLLPDYSKSNSKEVKLFIPRGLPDKAFVEMISDAQKKLGHNLPIYSLLILNYLKNNKKSTMKEMYESIHNDDTKIKVAVENLVEAGLVEARGENRNRNYLLSSKVYKADNNMVGYIRVSGIDQVKYEGLVLELAEKQGYVTRGCVVELLNVNPSQAYRILAKLTKENKLTLVGNKRNAKYYPL